MTTQIVMPAVYSVTCHTNFVGQGSTFVAIKGFLDNGLLYVEEAIEKGATRIVISDDAIVSERLQQLLEQKSIQVERTPNTRQALAHLSAASVGFPAERLKLFGVTGTKGKTTTTFLLAHILRACGHKVALISSVHNMIDGVLLPAPLTTPQPDYLQQFLKICVDAGVTHVVIEVAAQAVSMHRIEGITFDGIIFTNLDREHLEFYANMQDYFAAKCGIFKALKPHGIALVNGDDNWGSQLPPSYTRFSLTDSSKPIFGCTNKSNLADNTLQATIVVHTKAATLVCPSLVGDYNLYNAVAAVGMATLYGLDLEKVAASLATFEGAPGRFEKYPLSNGALCVIDSAHNPLSFRAVLSTLRSMTDHLIVVFGAGGDRDAGRRPEMGAIAASFCDLVILTSDNPRTEDPGDIIQQIQSGIELPLLSKVTTYIDRGAAIRFAYSQSRAHSIIALLGKGVGEYQIIGTTKMPFSERKILQNYVVHK